MKNFTERVKKILVDNDLSASQFSKIIGIQRSVVSHVLNKRNKPSLDFIIKITEAFQDITLDYLINGNEIRDFDKLTSTPFSQETKLKNKKNHFDNKEIKKIVIFYNDKSFEVFEK